MAAGLEREPLRLVSTTASGPIDLRGFNNDLDLEVIGASFDKVSNLLAWTGGALRYLKVNGAAITNLAAGGGLITAGSGTIGDVVDGFIRNSNVTPRVYGAGAANVAVGS